MHAANLFNQIDDWWDPKGSLRSLHWINPARLQYVQQQICLHFGRDLRQPLPYRDLKILDIGCGGGLVCEPLARLGATVTGIDLSETAIRAAQAHAAAQNLRIDYQCISAETLCGKPILRQAQDEVTAKATPWDATTAPAIPHPELVEGLRNGSMLYDAVLALDMLEHVDDPAALIQTIAQLTKAGGLVILSTINRSWQSKFGAIALAENVLQFVPKGAHQYELLIKPEELAGYCEAAGMKVHDLCGISPKPKIGGIEFQLSPNRLAINYLLCAKK